jgi:hypothetical protein
MMLGQAVNSLVLQLLHCQIAVVQNFAARCLDMPEEHIPNLIIYYCGVNASLVSYLVVDFIVIICTLPLKDCILKKRNCAYKFLFRSALSTNFKAIAQPTQFIP